MARRYRPSTFLILLATIDFSFGLLGAFFAHKTAENLKYDASIINHVGMIRGSIQRASKHALYDSAEFDQSGAEAIKLIDWLMKRFLSQEEGYRHRDARLQNGLIRDMNELAVEWEELKDAFVKHKLDRSQELGRKVMVRSERCWQLADAVVLKAQHASESKLAGVDMFYAIAALGLISTGIVVWFSYGYVRLQLEYNAAYDVTTSLLNRRSYDDELEREVSRGKRYKRTMSLIVFDIDNFKTVNDVHGHKTGDEVLKVVARLAKQHIRSTDSIFRLGGDEFAIIVPEADAAHAHTMAEKMRQAVAEHPFGYEEKITISLGVCELQGEMTPSVLCHLADNAMYQAKKDGRNITRRMQAEQS